MSGKQSGHNHQQLGQDALTSAPIMTLAPIVAPIIFENRGKVSPNKINGSVNLAPITQLFSPIYMDEKWRYGYVYFHRYKKNREIVEKSGQTGQRFFTAKTQTIIK